MAWSYESSIKNVMTNVAKLRNSEEEVRKLAFGIAVHCNRLLEKDRPAIGALVTTFKFSRWYWSGFKDDAEKLVKEINAGKIRNQEELTKTMIDLPPITAKAGDNHEITPK